MVQNASQHSNVKATRRGIAEQIPQQYAKPLRKTAYLHTYPHVVNGGLLYKLHEYPGILRFNQQQDRGLLQLFQKNEVSFTRDRQKDARSFGWRGGDGTQRNNYRKEGDRYSLVQPPIQMNTRM